MHCHKLARSLSHTYRALRKWNRESFCFAHEKIKSLEEELDLLQKDDLEVGRQRQINEELILNWAKLESIYWHKSRELWMKEGDRNLNFFYLSTIIRRRKNNIGAIRD